MGLHCTTKAANSKGADQSEIKSRCSHNKAYINMPVEIRMSQVI